MNRPELIPGVEPYYHDEEAGIAIYHGDCRELLPKIPDGAVDLVLTDPPYGFHKADWDSVFPEWMFDAIAGRSHAIGIMPGVWNIIGLPRRIGNCCYRWTLAAHIVNGMTRGCIGFGNWIPCAVYTDDTLSAYRTETDIRRFTVGVDGKPAHPSPKPLDVTRWFASRLPGLSVLDPFLGSGTTLVAAKQLGRRGIGIEIEERYCEIAANRLRQGVFQFPEAPKAKEPDPVLPGLTNETLQGPPCVS